VQIDPVSRALLHADFYRVDMNKTITVMVPLTFVNEPHNLLQSANAVLTHLWRELEVDCLPRDIPDEIVVDLADIHPGETYKAGAVVLPAGVTLVTDAEEVIVTVHIEVEAPAESSAEAEEAS
jgi:large subunit ribosomal protein L25